MHCPAPRPAAANAEDEDEGDRDAIQFWHCANGQRIVATDVCNNYFNCFDGSDETDCLSGNTVLSGSSSSSRPPTASASSPLVVSREFNSETRCFTTTYDFEENDNVTERRNAALYNLYGETHHSSARLVFSTSYRLVAVCLQLAGIFLGFITFALLAAVVTASVVGRTTTSLLAASALITSLLNVAVYAVVLAGWAAYCSAATELHGAAMAARPSSPKGSLEKAFYYMKDPGFEWQSSLEFLVGSEALHAVVAFSVGVQLCLKRRRSYGAMSESEDVTEQLNPS